jgi:hypothetical protein
MTDHEQFLIDAQGRNLTFWDWVGIIILSMVVSGGASMFAAQREREKRRAATQRGD